MMADPYTRLNAALAFGVPRISGLLIASQVSGPQPVPGICGPAFAAGRDGAR
jgi:hypothetical protein